ncbi:MAG: YceI family protein [Flavobacteriales bacterium]|nr:YceI family protein [Flavobacteriales bacterium]
MLRALRYSILSLLPVSVTAQAVYVADTSAIRFFSRTPIENIEAVNHAAKSTLSPPEYEVQFQVPVSGFRFENKLMEKHFNSMYLETDKFPFASFRGKLSDSLDLSKDTVYNIKATGILKMHGRDHAGVFDGRIESKDGRASLRCTFPVRLEDHNIKVPGSVFLNIAQEIEVHVYFEYVAKPQE